MLTAFYERAKVWSKHRNALYILLGLSFAESSFLIFPIPPDALLAPMAYSQPERAWRLSALTTLASVLGGVLGYTIGILGFKYVQPILLAAGYGGAYTHVQLWFQMWGFWAMFVAGFSPIPFKIFTIAAGVIKMPILPFVLAAVIGRGLRFFAISGLLHLGRQERVRNLNPKILGLVGASILVLFILLYKFLSHHTHL